MAFSRKQRWLLTSALAAGAAAWLTKAGLKYAWNATTGEDPPVNPADASTAWSEAVVWTLAASSVAALSQLAARRAVAATLGGPVPDGLYEA